MLYQDQPIVHTCYVRTVVSTVVVTVVDSVFGVVLAVAVSIVEGAVTVVTTVEVSVETVDGVEVATARSELVYVERCRDCEASYLLTLVEVAVLWH